MVSDTGDVVVVIGGGTLHPDALARAPRGAVVVAADSGLDVALEAGLEPHLLIGDLDSIGVGGRAWAESHGIPIERHDRDKAATDTELALARAAAILGAARLTVLSAMGDRFDHALGALTALGAPSLGVLDAVTAWFADVEVRTLHDHHRTVVDGPAGWVFSLLALHGACHDVEVHGARWPLRAATLEPASTLGVSNEIVDVPVEVAAGRGVVTVVIPPQPVPADARATPEVRR